MEKIGEGYWYNVFSLSEKRVRKVEKTYWQKIAHVFRLKKKQPIVFLRNAASFILERSNIITAYKHIEDRVDPSLLANPEFRNGIDYDQDCVRVLEDVFSTASTDRQKQIIDLYIDHIIVCLGYGFFDCKFNFLENNGLLDGGKIVLHDFNEITLGLNKVKELIEIERWKYAYSVKQLNVEVRSYFLKEMERRLTIGVLEENWSTNIN